MFFSSYTHGKLAECYVAFYLRLCGFKILRRRFRSPFGEIDIIAKRGKLVRFIEVKSRSSVGIMFEEAVNKHQILRIRNAAEFFLSNWAGQYDDMRVDVFFVYKICFIKKIVVCD